MLTILTSPHIEIHEQTMLLAIKTCYNIQITSSSLVNQASARAALTQIINTILFRLESSAFNFDDSKLEKQFERKITDDLSANLNLQSERSSLNGSVYHGSNQNENMEEHLENLNDMIQNIKLNHEHYKPMYMDTLRNFELEQVHFDVEKIGKKSEEDHNVISDLMCIMLDAVCDDEAVETNSIDLKLIEETHDHKLIFHNGLSKKTSAISNGKYYFIVY